MPRFSTADRGDSKRQRYSVVFLRGRRAQAIPTDRPEGIRVCPFQFRLIKPARQRVFVVDSWKKTGLGDRKRDDCDELVLSGRISGKMLLQWPQRTRKLAKPERKERGTAFLWAVPATSQACRAEAEERYDISTCTAQGPSGPALGPCRFAFTQATHLFLESETDDRVHARTSSSGDCTCLA